MLPFRERAKGCGPLCHRPCVCGSLAGAGTLRTRIFPTGAARPGPPHPQPWLAARLMKNAALPANSGIDPGFSSTPQSKERRVQRGERWHHTHCPALPRPGAPWSGAPRGHVQDTASASPGSQPSCFKANVHWWGEGAQGDSCCAPAHSRSWSWHLQALPDKARPLVA